MCADERNEVDCGDCRAAPRCWSGFAMPGGGHLVRRLRPLEAGQLLFRQGAPFDAPYVVTSGCVQVFEALENGAERIVAFRVPGELLGLESLCEPRHRHGARAIASSTVCRLRWNSSGVNGRGVPLLRSLLAKSSTQLRQASPPWAGLGSVERLRVFLEDFTRRTDQPLPMTRAQIGQYLGMAEETVVRGFAQLRRRGLLPPAALRPPRGG